MARKGTKPFLITNSIFSHFYFTFLKGSTYLLGANTECAIREYKKVCCILQTDPGVCIYLYLLMMNFHCHVLLA